MSAPRRVASTTVPIIVADDIQWELAGPPDTPTDADTLVVDLAIDAQSYRLCFQQAIHALHDLRQQLEQLRERHHRLLDEYRCLREAILRQEGA